MSHYRIYLMEGTEIVQGSDAECQDDNDAIEQGLGSLKAGEHGEVWSGIRFVQAIKAGSARQAHGASPLD